MLDPNDAEPREVGEEPQPTIAAAMTSAALEAMDKLVVEHGLNDKVEAIVVVRIDETALPPNATNSNVAFAGPDDMDASAVIMGAAKAVLEMEGRQVHFLDVGQ